jgi:serine/threonine protein kinase
MAVEATGRTESILDGIPQAGEIVGGKFVVERVLGIGGMGVVVAARHQQLGQQVAIKFLRRSAADSAESVNRFLREARSAVALQSAHVVRVMDVGTLDDGLPFMVMEYLSGTDLGHVLDVRTVLPVEEAVDYLLQALEAIAEAHSLGIVHRDLKPSNLFLTLRPDGSPLVKVLDFGISKAIDGGADQVSLTSTAMVLGSPLYMSPEQVRSTKNVDTRTDVWALGVILYELIAGAPPFEAESVTGLCAKIVADPPVPLRSRRPEVAVELEAVVARCLEKDVARRPRNIAELAIALKPFASVEGRMGVDRIARIGGAPRSSSAGVAESGRAVPRAPSASSPAISSPLASTPAVSAPSPSGSPGELATGYAETVASHQTMRTVRRRRVTTAALAIGGAAIAIVGLVARSSMKATIEGDRARSPSLAAEALVPAAPEPVAAPSAASAAAPPVPEPSAAQNGPVVAPSSSAAASAAALMAAPPPSAPPPAPRPAQWSPQAPRPAPPRPAAAPTAKPSAEELLLDRH